VDYKEAGVNIEEGYRAVGKYRELAAMTISAGPAGGGLRPVNGIGSFAGMLSLGAFARMEEPVLVSGTDGVGTKLDIAFRLKKYDTLGIDCVAMCVNDVLCHGGRPLFFLDYLACGKLDADVAAALVKGVALACRETGCVLLGGETAEMPGFYDEGKYDIAGFAVGIVDRKNIVDGHKIRAGDALIGLASSGVHSSGFSLIRKLITNLDEDFGGMPIGRALLEPTRLYVKPILGLIEQVEIRGMAHITGGGFYENIPRMFGDASLGEATSLGEVSPGEVSPGEGRALRALIRRGSWTIPPIFRRIAEGAGVEVDSRLMFNTYNMGIGFVIALAPGESRKAIEYLDGLGYPAWEIGTVTTIGEAGGIEFE
jgi:phosphoribosylformylglycinamidine cyclo-ligase